MSVVNTIDTNCAFEKMIGNVKQGRKTSQYVEFPSTDCETACVMPGHCTIFIFQYASVGDTNSLQQMQCRNIYNN